MNRSLKIVLSLAAGATLAAAAFSSRGKKVRSKLATKVGDFRGSISDNIEKRARRIHDSSTIYS